MKIEHKIVEGDSLYKLGINIFKSLKEFWKEHQAKLGFGSVVWLEDDEGQLFIFTRGEYKQQLKDFIDTLS